MDVQIGRYEVKRILGEGANGRVYLARDPKLGRDVAIKVLARGADQDVHERFRLEAKAVAGLKHPNIIELYDYSGEDAADLYIVMEYVPGPSLYELTHANGVMTEATALCVGHELSMALQHAHSHNVVHRDLKPENVLLHKGRIVLTDFGAVKAVAENNPLGQRRPQVKTRVLGTPGFMAPEQFAGKRIEARTDIFALGATLYNLTTGQIPYKGGTVDAIYKNLKTGRLELPTEHQPLLSPDFCKLLAWCLAPKISDRCGSATELRQRIVELAAQHGVVEIRGELARYQERPATITVEQRERSIDVLLKELKVALKDRDNLKAKSLVNRIQVLAPLDDRIKDVSGISFDTRLVRSVVSLQRYRRARWRWLLIGMVLGAATAWGVGYLVGPP